MIIVTLAKNMKYVRTSTIEAFLADNISRLILGLYFAYFGTKLICDKEDGCNVGTSSELSILVFSNLRNYIVMWHWFEAIVQAIDRCRFPRHQEFAIHETNHIWLIYTLPNNKLAFNNNIKAMNGWVNQFKIAKGCKHMQIFW